MGVETVFALPFDPTVLATKLFSFLLRFVFISISPIHIALDFEINLFPKYSQEFFFFLYLYR